VSDLTFLRLNENWNAQPNAPYPEVRAEGSTVQLRFFLNSYAYPAKDGELGFLTFTGCKAWRLGSPNDEGWYEGECRYGKLAPKWGEFYELKGPDPLRDQAEDWRQVPTLASGSRHFLFYLRDETFECLADDWKFERGSTNVEISSVVSETD
jgi:hypothetical protein